jgi:hypothetical protein
MNRYTNIAKMDARTIVESATHETIVDTCKRIAPQVCSLQLDDLIEIIDIKMYHIPMEVVRHVIKPYNTAKLILIKERNKKRMLAALP